jgi:hypothetical protein
MVEFNQSHRAVLDDLLSGDIRVKPGKMFGYPAYYAGGKLCFCVYGEGVGIKLPAGTVARLLETDPNVIPFVPMGRRRMREWVQIDVAASEEYRRYLPLFDESIRHVLSAAEKP